MKPSLHVPFPRILIYHNIYISQSYAFFTFPAHPVTLTLLCTHAFYMFLFIYQSLHLNDKFLETKMYATLLFQYLGHCMALLLHN